MRGLKADAARIATAERNKILVKACYVHSTLCVQVACMSYLSSDATAILALMRLLCS